MLRNYSIGTRIIAIIVILLFTIAALVGTIVLTAERVKDSGIADAQSVMLEGEKAKLKLGTHTIATALGKALEGVKEPETQAAIISNYINKIRFEADSSGYYFVYKGTVVFVHPVQPGLEGKDLGQTKDDNGVYYVSELHKAAKAGGGFVSFIFGKPQKGGSTVNTPKLAYVEMIPGTDLWISTGIYIDNIDVYKADMEQRMSDELFNRVIIIISCVLALFLFLLLPLCVLTVRSISRPLRETTTAAEEIASGNLKVSLPADGKDEVSALQNALLRMALNLQSGFAEVQKKESEALAQAEEAQKAASTANEAMRKADAANEGMMQAAMRLETAANEMEASANSISGSTAGVKQGAASQNDRIKEILIAMQQLSDSVLEVARSAGMAADKSEESRQKVEEGVLLAQESGKAMDALRALTDELTGNIQKLGEQSNTIGQIMNVINDIADQTNLLALNAAIEAARAGEYGRGFAVVADEVRKLAEKTVQATQQVHASIKNIRDSMQVSAEGVERTTKTVHGTVELGHNAQDVLKDIVELMQGMNEQIHGIAGLCREQATAGEQVSSAVDSLRTLSASVSEAMKEGAEISHALAPEAKELGLLVDELTASR